MSEIPKKSRKKHFYWPLGSLGYSPEIRDFFPEEAELIGIITIMWNRQELALRRIFLDILEARTKDYAEAIWDRQPTHQSKRDLLAIAIQSAEISERAKEILRYIIEKTKTLADRRNELVHAEYMVSSHTEVLHAKVKSPRSTKPPKYQKLSQKDLQKIVDDLDHLLNITESSYFEFLSPVAREKHEELMRELKSLPKPSHNRQTD